MNAKSVKRSSTVLLVKNLPASANENDLKQMFMKSGELVRFIMPPTKTMALLNSLKRKMQALSLDHLLQNGISKSHSFSRWPQKEQCLRAEMIIPLLYPSP